jgi:hypothetical protein
MAIGSLPQGSSAPESCLPLNPNQLVRLARIRRDRRQGWMISLADCDFLLEVIEQLRERAR